MSDLRKQNNEHDIMPTATEKKSKVPKAKNTADNFDDFSSLDERFGQRNKNEYYQRVSSSYRKVKLVLVIMLVIVLLFAIVIASDDLSYSNIRYMLRNFTEITTKDSERASTVKFSAETNTACEAFSGKIAVACDEGVSLYRASGKKIFTEAISLFEPRLTVGDKYFFVWSSGKDRLYIFNSVSLVREEKFDYPIYSVVAGADGCYAVLTEESGVTSAVLVYNKNFQCILKKSVDSGYVSSIALSPDGALLSSAAFTTRNGQYVTRLENIQLSDGSVTFEAEHVDAFPLEIGFFEDSGQYFIGSASVFVYSKYGEFLYSDKTASSVRAVCSTGKHLAYLVSSASVSKESEIKVVSADGVLSADVMLDGSVFDIALTDYSAVFLSSDYIIVSLEDGGRTDIKKSNNPASLFADGQHVYSLFSDRAELILSSGEPVT